MKTSPFFPELNHIIIRFSHPVGPKNPNGSAVGQDARLCFFVWNGTLCLATKWSHLAPSIPVDRVRFGKPSSTFYMFNFEQYCKSIGFHNDVFWGFWGIYRGEMCVSSLPISHSKSWSSEFPHLHLQMLAILPSWFSWLNRSNWALIFFTKKLQFPEEKKVLEKVGCCSWD